MTMVLFFALRRLDLLDKEFLGRIGIWLWTRATWAGQVLVSRPSRAKPNSNKTLGKFRAERDHVSIFFEAV
jgi:hypothetical protein